jgi:argininosuccinate lyase
LIPHERSLPVKLWGGRFEEEADARLRRLNDSLRFDRRLYTADIRGSQAYAGALLKVGLLAEEEHRLILAGLVQVQSEFETGEFEPAPGDEDIHTAVERRLTELIGEPAGKLHTGRSRNDQVALDLRLWLLDEMAILQEQLAALQEAILAQARRWPGLLMPGYTHLQPAQPVLYAHWILSYFWMFGRDRERLREARQRTAVSPLGAGALAGNPFPLDLEALAQALGMASAAQNSMDAVSDRDFAAEFLFCAALIGVHLSHLAEDLILFSSPQWGFVRLPEAFTTGSSLMPQKRNPDPLELARGKTGRLLGDLAGMLVVLKGLPSTYNKDLQEDKELAFDAADTLDGLLPVIAAVVSGLEPSGEAMQAALDPSMLATDLADYLVRRGVPFRTAHRLAGECVRAAEARGVPLDRLPLENYREISAVFAEDVLQVFDYTLAVERRAVTGGTAPAAVDAQLRQAEQWLAENGV